MKKIFSILVIALVAVLMTGFAAADEKNTWVTSEGHAVSVRAGHSMFFSDEDGEAFNLSDLADGESRTFGEGDKQITATRLGDIVTLNREASGDEKSLEIKCDVERDTCKVMTFDEDPEKVMIIVKKTRECVHGVGDCDGTVDITLDQLGDFDGKNVHAIVRKVKCDDEGNCEESHDVHGHGGHGLVEVIADFDGMDTAGNVMVFHADGMGGNNQVVLSCPEGDSTVRVDAEEAEDTFLCPKHSVPMEKVATPHFIRKIKIDEDE